MPPHVLCDSPPRTPAATVSRNRSRSSSAAHPQVRPRFIARDGAAAAAHGQQALVGEPAIRPRDGIPMHTEVPGQLPHGGQILAGTNAPLGNRLAQAPGNLVLERAGVVDVDPNHDLTVSYNDTVDKRISHRACAHLARCRRMPNGDTLCSVPECRRWPARFACAARSWGCSSAEDSALGCQPRLPAECDRHIGGDTDALADREHPLAISRCVERLDPRSDPERRRRSGGLARPHQANELAEWWFRRDGDRHDVPLRCRDEELPAITAPRRLQAALG